MKKKLVIITTVSETLSTILKGQPSWLSKHFQVFCVTSFDGVHLVEENETVFISYVPMRRGIAPFRDIVSFCRLYITLHQIKPDIVHSYTPKAGFIAMSVAFFLRVPIRIHTFTGLLFPTAKGIKKKILYLVDRWVDLLATHVVPEGEGVKADLIEAGACKNLVDVIGSGNIAGVDLDYFNPSLFGRSFFEYGDAFTFCYVGRLHRDKGIKELVRAFSQVERHARLVLVGGVDDVEPLDSDTLALINDHPDIFYVGFKEDIRGVLSSIDILLLPSYREGFPNVVLQAGAMAKPAIVSDINGCNEIIEHGKNGWLVPPHDALALKNAMDEAMSLSQDQIRAMGSTARAKIERCFARQQYLDSLLRFYEKVLY